jgi:hypothetical protein
MIDLEEFPIDITYQVKSFRDFLVASWPLLDTLMKGHDWGEDVCFSDEWIQVNWEFLIERELLGEGKYIFPLFCNNRITFPESVANYMVTCKVEQREELRDRLKKTLNYQNEELIPAGF